MSKYLSMEDILRKDTLELTALNMGEFSTLRLGVIPFTALEHKEYAQAKKDSTTYVQDKKTHVMRPDLDDDKLMIKVIIAAVDKDKRSTFTFASKDLINKLQELDPNIVKADDAVRALLAPGEIMNFAIAIQEASGFGPGAEEEIAEDIKNS